MRLIVLVFLLSSSFSQAYIYDEKDGSPGFKLTRIFAQDNLEKVQTALSGSQLDRLMLFTNERIQQSLSGKVGEAIVNHFSFPKIRRSLEKAGLIPRIKKNSFPITYDMIIYHFIVPKTDILHSNVIIQANSANSTEFLHFILTTHRESGNLVITSINYQKFSLLPPLLNRLSQYDDESIASLKERNYKSYQAYPLFFNQAENELSFKVHNEITPLSYLIPSSLSSHNIFFASNHSTINEASFAAMLKVKENYFASQKELLTSSQWSDLASEMGHFILKAKDQMHERGLYQNLFLDQHFNGLRNLQASLSDKITVDPIASQQ